MKKLLSAIALAATVFGVYSPASALTDTIQFSTGYFTPNEASTYSSPYYRWYNEDWGWSHTAIGGTFTTATLNISAWDVDAPYEIDNIYAYDGVNKVLLGSLAGNNNAWGYSTFTLGSNFFDDIATGLKVWIDIDAVNPGSWAVSLANSTLILDSGTLPPPNPGAVPEPSTVLLLGGGLAGLAFWRRKQQKK